IRLLQAEVNVQEDRFVLDSALPEYRRAFQDYGLRAETTAPDEAAALLRRPPPAGRGAAGAAPGPLAVLGRPPESPGGGLAGAGTGRGRPGPLAASRAGRAGAERPAGPGTVGARSRCRRPAAGGTVPARPLPPPARRPRGRGGTVAAGPGGLPGRLLD